MRTTLNIDDQTMHTLFRVTRAPTKTRAVTQALQDYVRRQQIEELRQLRGKLRLGRDWKRWERLEVKDAHRGPR